MGVIKESLLKLLKGVKVEIDRGVGVLKLSSVQLPPPPIKILIIRMTKSKVYRVPNSHMHS